MIELLIKASLIIIVLLAFYKILLEKESFFATNRLYLLGCLFFACILPLITLPKIIEHQGVLTTLLELSDEKEVRSIGPAFLPKVELPAHPETAASNINESTIKNSSSSVESNTSYKLDGISEHKNSIDKKSKAKNSYTKNQQDGKGFSYWLIRLYFFGFAVFLLKFLAQLAYIFWLILKNEDTIDDEESVLVNLKKNLEPCSFFKYIFINPNNFDYETYEQIIEHEKIHVRQWHSIDLLLAEFAVVVLWFNPFIWVLRKEVEKNIEYQTDYLIITEKPETKENYQLNLMKMATYSQPLSITTNYNQSLISQRILKMNAKKSNQFSYWKYTFIPPVLFLLLLFLNEPHLGNAQTSTTSFNDSISSAVEISKGKKVSTATNVESADGCKRLSKAIYEQNLPEIKKILTIVDPNCVEFNGISISQFKQFIKEVHTPLSAAAKIGNLEIIKLLLDAGAKIDSHNVYLKSPLMAASNEGHLDIVKFLVKNGANINAISGNHGTPLHQATKGGNLEIVSYLLEQGANINAYTYPQGTPLNGAVKNKHVEMVTFLIDKGAIINEQNKTQISAFARAAGRGDNEMIKLLLSKGGEIDPEGSKHTALFSAAWYGHPHTVELLLSKGANINHQNNQQYGSALIAASNNGHSETVKVLLSNGANIDLKSGQKTALVAAASNGQTETVVLLLSKGASIDLKIGHNTALIAAASNGQTETVDLLLSKGANINLQNEKQGSALNVAAGKGRYKTVALLLSRGADINAQNGVRGAALNAAARNGHTKTVELLLEKGANINAQNNTQGTALNAAARNGHLTTVKLLVSEGADINLNNKGEGTAIAAAARNAQHQVVRFLESKGAQY